MKSILTALLFSFARLSASTQEPKNVPLLCVDDLRSVIGCYGGSAKTPHLDKLAKSSAVFTHHYNQWPVCGPSRASMLGGLRPDSTGIYEIGDSWKIAKRPETHPTLPKYFKDNGYRTLSFGKIYHSPGHGEGFGWSEKPWKLNWDCYVDFEYEGKGKKKSWRPAIEIFKGPESKHNDFQTADQVIAALEENREKAFFIAGGFFKPHLPFVAPKAYRDLHSEDEIRRIEPFELPNGAANHMYAFSEISSYGLTEGKLIAGDASIGRKQARRLIHAYYACVSFIDAQIGRILGAVEMNGLAANTAIVIWSDHGFHLGDQERWAKHTQFEQAMSCPLIIRLPGRQAIAGETKAIAESVDIYPTLCDFAGLLIPEFVEGESLVPVLEGKWEGKEVAYSQIRPVKRRNPDLMAYSIRTRNFRYVEWREPDNGNQIFSRELYDFREQLSEVENIAADPRYGTILSDHSRLVANGFLSLE